MTKVKIYTKENLIVGFKLEGHSGFALVGFDIVCAAVSAMSQSTVIGLTEVLALPVSVTQNEAYLICLIDDLNSIPWDVSFSAQMLMKTFVLSLKDLAEQYPQYLNIKEVAYDS